MNLNSLCLRGLCTTASCESCSYDGDVRPLDLSTRERLVAFAGDLCDPSFAQIVGHDCQARIWNTENRCSIVKMAPEPVRCILLHWKDEASGGFMPLYRDDQEISEEELKRIAANIVWHQHRVDISYKIPIRRMLQNRRVICFLITFLLHPRSSIFSSVYIEEPWLHLGSVSLGNFVMCKCLILALMTTL